MKPWIFWTGQVPDITGYDQYANPVEEKPRALRRVRIVVVGEHKYVIEIDMGTDALGAQMWIDAHEMGSTDPAMVLDACLLDIIARRNALGWISRAEMPPEPRADEPVAQIEAFEVASGSVYRQSDGRWSGVLDLPSDGVERKREATQSEADPANLEPLGDAGTSRIAHRGPAAGYKQRCLEKWTHAGVVNELQRNTARGRILRTFTKGVGHTLRNHEIATPARCSGVTVSNYCKDYEAAGWLKYGNGGWTLVRAVPEVEAVEGPKPPTWQTRNDLKKTEIIIEHPNGDATLYQVGAWWRLRDAKQSVHGLDTENLEEAKRFALKILEGDKGHQPWKAAEPAPAAPNGSAAISSIAPLIDRVVDALSRGPQKFDRLAGLLVVGTKPLSDVLADLVGDGTVILKDSHYQLDETV